MTRREFAIVAAVWLVLTAIAAASGQTTRPADSLVYQRADGRNVVLVPATGPAPVNREVLGATVTRPGGGVGVWVLPATQPAIPPKPATLPVVVAPDPNTVRVTPGDSWVEAVRQAAARRKAGAPPQTVELAAGNWSEGLTDPSILLNGVTIRGAGIGKTCVRVPQGTALWAWCPTDLTVSGITFTADVPTDAIVRINGGVGVTLEDVELFGGIKGLVSERAQSGSRPPRLGKSLRLVRCQIHDNYDPHLAHPGCGIFASDTHGITIDGCDLRHNGWREGVTAGDVKSHNCYITGDCSGLRFVNNVSAYASSHGLQARCGGVVEGNLFAFNPIHLSYGYVNGDGVLYRDPATRALGVSGSVGRNAFVGSRLLAGAERGWAVEFDNVASVDVTDNLLWTDGRLLGSRGLIVAPFKVDVAARSDKSPDRKVETAVKRLKFAGNTLSWPDNVGGPLYVNPKHKGQTRSAGGVIPQDRWDAPAAAAVADARARAAR